VASSTASASPTVSSASSSLASSASSYSSTAPSPGSAAATEMIPTTSPVGTQSIASSTSAPVASTPAQSTCALVKHYGDSPDSTSLQFMSCGTVCND
jgi:hypothetical protein